jgi:hypothetical protein
MPALVAGIHVLLHQTSWSATARARCPHREGMISDEEISRIWAYIRSRAEK